MIDPNLNGLVGIHIVADSYGLDGKPIREVIHLDNATVMITYDIDFHRYNVRIEGNIPQDRLMNADSSNTVPPHPAETSKEITDGEEEVIIAELIED